MLNQVKKVEAAAEGCEVNVGFLWWFVWGVWFLEVVTLGPGRLQFWGTFGNVGYEPKKHPEGITNV